jgi:hypothetical protein
VWTPGRRSLYVPAMENQPPLRPATRDEVRDSLGYALRFNRSGKAHHHASEMMARIAADVLVDHLELSGFVIMKKPPLKPHSTSGMMNSKRLTD